MQALSKGRTSLHLAPDQGRVANVAADPLLPLRAFWNLGG
jgi:hypothetical protein